MDHLEWDHPNPFVTTHTALADEADGYGHINNSVYLKWIDHSVWEHCKAVDMPADKCREIDRGFATVRHEIDYLAAAYPGDEVIIGNWVTFNDGRLRAERNFQIIRINDNKTILRARSDYICTKLSNGRPVKMPEVFKQCFSITSK